MSGSPTEATFRLPRDHGRCASQRPIYRSGVSLTSYSKLQGDLHVLHVCTRYCDFFQKALSALLSAANHLGGHFGTDVIDYLGTGVPLDSAISRISIQSLLHAIRMVNDGDRNWNGGNCLPAEPGVGN